MAKFRKWILGIICLLLIACFVLFSVDEPKYGNSDTLKQNLYPKIKIEPIESAQEPLNIDETSVLTLALNYQSCKRTEKSYKDTNRDWFDSEKPSWQSLLNEGYTFDDVTLAIEYFKNSNFAASFRIEQLRTNSSLSNANQSIMELARDLFPEMFSENSGFRLEKRVPSIRFESFNELSAEKRIALLNEVAPSIDDIAYFITQSEYTDDEIILFLKYVEDPLHIVVYDNIEAISLLDFAVKNLRVEVVEYLFDFGAVPTEDAYLDSTMELALSQLSSSLSGHLQDNAAKIVQLIHDKGGRARFSEQSDNMIVGQFSRKSYEFDAEALSEYRQKYSLDLNRILPRQALKVNENSGLIRKLLQKRNDYFYESMGIADIASYRHECIDTLSNFNGLWKPLSPHKVIQKTIEKKIQTPEEIESSLALIDPLLVDIYRQRYKVRLAKFSSVFDVEHIFRQLDVDDFLEVIDAFLELSLDREQKNWVVMQLLSREPNYFRELKNSGLMENEPQYFSYEKFKLLKYDKIRKLHESGANLLGSDSLGKTFLYYAAKKGDLKLLEYMYEENFPFTQTKIGEDPLHVALKEKTSSVSVKNSLHIYGLVDALMKFAPKIDEFHLSRMALLKIVEPDNYRQIIMKYPELEPKPDSPLPAVRLFSKLDLRGVK
jgi:ankyrin repeat protein